MTRIISRISLLLVVSLFFVSIVIGDRVFAFDSFDGEVCDDNYNSSNHTPSGDPIIGSKVDSLCSGYFTNKDFGSKPINLEALVGGGMDDYDKGLYDDDNKYNDADEYLNGRNKVSNIEEFVAYYEMLLFGNDSENDDGELEEYLNNLSSEEMQDNTYFGNMKGAAMVVLSMMGHDVGEAEDFSRNVDGLNNISGLNDDRLKALKTIVRGIYKARKEFGEWEERVRRYDTWEGGTSTVPASGLVVDFHYNYSFPEGHINGGSAVKDNDDYPVDWEPVRHAWYGGEAYTVRFYYVDPNNATLNQKTHVLIERPCSNMVGPVDGFGEGYSISANSSIKKSVDGGYVPGPITAAPGQIAQWTHTLANIGSNNMGENLSYKVQKGDGASWSDVLGSSGISSGDAGGVPFVQLSPSTGYLSYTITQADVGKTICQRIVWALISATDIGGHSTAACVNVPYNYSLEPSIGSDILDIVEADAEYNVPTDIVNTGPTRSKQTEWQISQVVVLPGKTAPHEEDGGDNPNEACNSYFVSTNTTCTTLASGTNGYFEGNGANEDGVPLGGRSDTSISATAHSGDLAVGTRLCYAISVKPHSSGGANEWRHSPLVCSVVGKKPKLQVWGGDTVVRGEIKTSTSTKGAAGATITYGSWGQYSVLSGGVNKGMASGSGLSGGSASADQSFWSKLTFANVGGFGTYNSSANFRALPAVQSRLSSSGDINELSSDTVDDINELNGIYHYNGDLTIKGGTLDKNRSVIISATGTVTISGDVRYTNDTLISIAEIPQIVIMAKAINITDAVVNIDAWLVTPGVDGQINTCSRVGAMVLDRTAKLSSKTCDKPLTINGPVMSGKLYLRRTAGSGTAAESGYPAEVINLRPDAYLWAYQRASGSGRAQTVMTTELSPRF